MTSKDLYTTLQSIAYLKQEHVLCITLDSSGQVATNHTIFIGSLTSSIIHPREIFADVTQERAAAFILAHNHPSGIVEPSKADIDVTQQLIAGGRILGIPLRDHLIIGGKKHFSFLAEGLISPVDYEREEGERCTD
jgi:DNA repair protein RadC